MCEQALAVGTEPVTVSFGAGESRAPKSASSADEEGRTVACAYVGPRQVSSNLSTLTVSVERLRTNTPRALKRSRRILCVLDFDLEKILAWLIPEPDECAKAAQH